MARRIKCFEADIDVEKGMKRAIRDGLKVTNMLNCAMRDWLRRNHYLRVKEMKMHAKRGFRYERFFR